jgi:hypothetical protein
MKGNEHTYAHPEIIEIELISYEGILASSIDFGDNINEEDGTWGK